MIALVLILIKWHDMGWRGDCLVTSLSGVLNVQKRTAFETKTNAKVKVATARLTGNYLLCCFLNVYAGLITFLADFLVVLLIIAFLNFRNRFHLLLSSYSSFCFIIFIIILLHKFCFIVTIQMLLRYCYLSALTLTVLL